MVYPVGVGVTTGVGVGVELAVGVGVAEAEAVGVAVTTGVGLAETVGATYAPRTTSPGTSLSPTPNVIADFPRPVRTKL